MQRKPLTKKEVKNVILKFWHLNASRAPITDFLPIVDINNFVIKVQNTDIQFRGIAGFADHQISKLIYFDQRFILKSMKITSKPEFSIAKSLVIWEARRWESPAANSELLKAIIHHTWIVKRSAETRAPIIVTHIAEKFKYLQGFAPKESQPEFHLRLG